VTAFAGPHALYLANECIARIGINRLDRSPSRICSSSSDDDWDLGDSGDDDPRVDAMRSMLESSWDGATMGVIPSGPEKAAEAAGESVADAMGKNKNVIMIDLRLPSYDITEGPKMYDIMSVYDFCSFLSDRLIDRNLIRKSLVLVRNEKERVEIDRVRSQRDGQSISNAKDDDIGEDGALETSEGGSEVDDFRKNLMTSWESTSDGIVTDGEAKARPLSEEKVPENVNSSHRLWSMVGNEDISGGPDMFDQVIAAADKNARLSADEDALIILSPYDTTDTICMRRILARYGQTRTVIIVNSRMETLPRELDPAVLVYGILPLIAVSKGNDDGNEAGLKAVVMKRYPAEWAVYVDVNGDGFVATKGTQSGGSDKQFPSPEWIAQRVQAHVKGLPKQ